MKLDGEGRGGSRSGSLYGWVAVVDPVGTEVVGDVDGLEVGEAQLAELMKGRADVGTFGPWAAAAVDDEQLVVVKMCGGLAEVLHAFAGNGGACVDGAADMGFLKKRGKSDLENGGRVT